MLLKKYIKPIALRVLVGIILAAMLLVMVGGRLYSGVHWVTDIAGGVFLSIALLCLFGAILKKIRGGYQPTHLKR